MNIRKTINFLRLRKFFYVVAVALMLASVGSLAVKQLNLGLDFTGGALVELNYSEAADLEAIRATLRENGWGDAVVQNFGASTDVLIRLPSDDPNLGNQVAQMIKTTDGSDVSVKRVEFIGPQVGEELRDQGGLGMLVAIAGILLYVSLRFQMKFAVAAILALVHDVIFTLGVFSFFGISFDLTVLAAILAVIGYSLNDTIVVFDRVRENMRLMRQTELTDIINISTTQTLGRTMATSFSTILVLLALFWFGGENIHGFATALLIGVGVGTYSSIYIAGGLLVTMKLTRDDLIPPQVEEAVDDRP
ncbi:protein translocase subunit SecF [Halopseudomonas aestusnigri]|jgi:preprotein translocase subunit SecF|uniref:protein translocase subunit SecF n=1 Tax=Halopseudomonas TaxID=2901189 RepID=UPI001D192839|nr:MULTISPECIES: protein translocase subunit SecF [Halopseudomonas]MCC4262418.1 protein translocase subunit SecF [Halopseudomonas aestusnigri]MDL2198556.1 protein translocase subunit SecF [Halopseudomonas aestusnigri]UGV31332.1 protein translocase subunit SecF [Halopseudomonas aestusnigri]BDX17538.1 protein translocase subunit SecF [Halopseudomonas aestusnigri]GMQ54374.1 protein translocase subunit SecF [Halopseudomonas aestusnigri]|tara:strand:+ start:2874 stop:3788 length:915 start_codon:yes stop_codon:yes gene_type:complete